MDHADPDTPPTASAEILRRPIKARNAAWAQGLARRAARAGLRPNAISLLSVWFALLGAVALIAGGRCESAAVRAALLLLAAGCAPLRLLCNLLDGLVAVEGGFKTPSGEIYNELPDRISDALFLAAAGYATHRAGWGPDLGWAAAVAAVIVAYVRTLGGQAGASQQFCGPMAKQQRMVILSAACVLTAAEALAGWPPRALVAALGVIALGSIWTAARRTARIVRELEEKARNK